MACINMFNPEHQGLCSPRISFSNDFAVEPPPPSQAQPGPSDSDFEFSVGSRPMMAADQLFSKGRLLPLKENHQYGGHRVTTLRDELRFHDEDVRPIRGSIRWKEMLGLKKAHLPAHKKGDRTDAAVAEAAEANTVKPSQELRRDVNLILE
ncbi:uncharacterized protein [Typha latifolia]|uniref:uncharacterized protein n=1 Tax=Typha latifolia TaxID=4733 RepID=UPI003C2D5C59